MNDEENELFSVGRLLSEKASVSDPGVHYRYEYKGIKLDPYRIAETYKLNDPALFTILKKVLRAGRAHKDLRQDLKDIIAACERKIEMLNEDE
jgi:N-methylhydantoinase B/oxoprolinase/acetone carboxylase alpha subunit